MDHNEICLSDHFGIRLNLDVKTKYVIKQPKRKIFNYNKGDFRGLNSELRNINWDIVFSSNDPYLAWNHFRNI